MRSSDLLTHLRLHAAAYPRVCKSVGHTFLVASEVVILVLVSRVLPGYLRQSERGGRSVCWWSNWPCLGGKCMSACVGSGTLIRCCSYCGGGQASAAVRLRLPPLSRCCLVTDPAANPLPRLPDRSPHDSALVDHAYLAVCRGCAGESVMLPTNPTGQLRNLATPFHATEWHLSRL